MRRLLLILLAGPAIADPVEDAAEKALVANRAGDAAALRALAAKDAPDPWIIAFELCARGEHDAAEAFAKAAPRKDVEKLPEYVASRRGKGTDSSAREALAATRAAFAAKDFEGVVRSVGDLPATTADDVAGVVLGSARASALRALGRPEESVQAYLAAAIRARGLGWLAGAARDFADAGDTAFQVNFRAALSAWEEAAATSLARGDRSSLLVALGNVGNLHHRLGDYRKALDANERALEIAQLLDNRSNVAAAFTNIGNDHKSLGDRTKALDYHGRALELYEELKDGAGIARTLLNVGAVHQELRDHAKALDCYARALVLMEALPDHAGVAMALGSMGNVYYDLRDFAKALEFQERALKANEELDHRVGIARTLGNIANVHNALGDYPKALHFHERALRMKEALGDRPGLEITLRNIALTHYDLRDYPKALEFLGRALDLNRELGRPATVATTLVDMANVRHQLGEYAKALELQTRALEIQQELGDRRGAAMTLGNMGNAHYAIHDYAKALECYGRALDLEEQLGDRAGTAWSLASIGRVHFALGNDAKALEFHERALKRHEELGDRAGAATDLVRIGHVRYSLGDQAKALDSHTRALDLAEELGNRALAAMALENIGLVHQALGDELKALHFHERALTAMEQLRNRAGIARTLGNIGRVHGSLGDYAKALDYQNRALKLMEEIGDRGGRASLLCSAGQMYVDLAEYGKALAAIEAATKLLEETRSPPTSLAPALRDLGFLHYLLGDYPRALGYQERSLRLYEEAASSGHVAAMLANIGNTHQRLGDHARAVGCLERALAIAEQLGDRNLVGSTLNNLAWAYSKAGEQAKALALLERALAKENSLAAGDAALLDSLATVHRDMGNLEKALAAHDRAASLLSPEDSPDVHIRVLWGAAACRLAAGDARAAADGARSAANLVARSVRGLEDEQGARARDVFAGVFETGVAASRALGDTAGTWRFLEDGRAGSLVEGLGLRDRLEAVVLPKELSAAERAARARELTAFAAYRRAVKDRAATDAPWKELQAARQDVAATIGRIQREAKAQAALLYPEADSLDTLRATLRPGEVFVSYALLERSAFALVVTPEVVRIVDLDATQLGQEIEAFQRAVGRPDERGVAAPAHERLPFLRDRLAKVLIEPLGLEKAVRLLVSPDGLLAYVPFSVLTDLEVAYVPSGTTCRLLREERGRGGEKVLAIGDPDYGTPGSPAASVYRGSEGLEPLPSARAEAQAVGDVVLLGARATRAGLADALAKGPPTDGAAPQRWRAVHFACHGLVDPERPALSSLALTEEGEDEGFLKCLDVYQMRIPADLVVLSACETGKGKIYRAEGVVGFTRAFMFAGAPRVIVSLWKVDDEATRALMEKFYELWKPGKMGAAAALRAAQGHVRSQERWRHPYFWAAWQLWGLPE